MTNKQIRLPREGLRGPEDGAPAGDGFIDGTDVEGHGWTNPAPPIDLNPRMPTHGGELFPTDTEDDTQD